MSMLSAQVDRLRETANNLKKVQELSTPWAKKNLVPLLSEAADTIESLRDKLLNATLGSGECELVDNGPWGYPYTCSACRAQYDPDILNGEWNHCPNCGKAVKR